MEEKITSTSSNIKENSVSSENFKRKRRFPSERPRRNMKNLNEDMNANELFMAKINEFSGPTFELPSISNEEKMFNGKNRLYIGNMPNDITEEDLETLFKPFGTFEGIFMNADKKFAFIKMETLASATNAKRALDGSPFKNKNLRVRFAPSANAIKVKNLTPFVSNELLHYAFRVFGPVDRAVICTDERGNSTGEGIVEFSTKYAAQQAVAKCNEGCFFISGSLRPCVVEFYEPLVDNDGLLEKNIYKRANDFAMERESGLSYALPGTFKYDYGQRWKQLFELFHEKELTLKKQFVIEKEKLEAEMKYAKYDHETEVLREQLRLREYDRELQKREWELKEKDMEDQRRKIEATFLLQQEDMEKCMRNQEENIRIREEENKKFREEQNNQYIQKNHRDQRVDSEQNYKGYNATTRNNFGVWKNEISNTDFRKRRRF